MSKEKLKILIVEDNDSQGRVLVEACKRKGYECTWVKTPAEALDCLKFNDFRVAIVDLMLPKMNGMDLAAEIDKITHVETHFVFISGVFKNKSIMKKAMDNVPCLGFLQKPFDLEDLFQIVDDFAKPYLVDATPEIYKLFYHSQPSINELVLAINETKVIHGFDLPWVYSLLINSKVNGKLHLMSSTGEIFTCEFHNGNLTFINLDDSQTYFGALLVNMGFSEKNEIDLALTNKTGGKKIGEQLMDQASISPHIIELIKKEQLRIRISKSVANVSYEVSFEPTDTEDEKIYLSYEEMGNLIRQIIISKVTADWLKAFFTPWYTHQIFKGVQFDLLDELLQLPILSKFSKIKKIIDADATIEKIVEANTKFEDDLLKALYLLLNLKVLQLSPKSTASGSDEAQIKRFKKIYATMQSQTLFEVLGVSTRAPEKEVSKGYHELAKVLHPDKLSQTASPKLRQLTEDIFSLITEAYTTLKNEDKKQAYLDTLEVKQAEVFIKNEGLLDKAKNCLEKRKYLQAFEYLEEVHNSKEKPGYSNIYYVWAMLKKSYSKKSKSKVLREALELLNQVPTEDRHMPDYFHVKGLYYILTGELQKADRSFMQAINLDPSNIAAKREVSRMRSAHTGVDFGSKTILFDLDVTEALSAIFRKSKKKIS